MNKKWKLVIKGMKTSFYYDLNLISKTITMAIYEISEKERGEFTSAFFKILENFWGIYQKHTIPISWDSEQRKPSIDSDLMKELPDEKAKEINDLIQIMFSA